MDKQQDKAAARVLTEWLNDGYGVSLKAGLPLESFRSAYQHIEVVDTDALGRVFLLDGSLMTSTGDEWFYHECAVHPAALAHPAPHRALIVGGGDGGAARQLLKHPSIERVTLCELDQAVLDMARRHFFSVHQGALDDTRVELQVGDGMRFLENSTQCFDLIILDLTDPVGTAAALYTPAFFVLCREHLSPGGALSLHLGSPQFQPGRVTRLYRDLCSVFARVRPYLVPIALYGGLWAMACASDKLAPADLDSTAAAARLSERRIDGLNYYNAATHYAVQALPPFVSRLLK
jgi:spermidine synthase